MTTVRIMTMKRMMMKSPVITTMGNPNRAKKQIPIVTRTVDKKRSWVRNGLSFIYVQIATII